VCLSVTRWYCTKTAKGMIMQTTSPGTLSYYKTLIGTRICALLNGAIFGDLE